MFFPFRHSLCLRSEQVGSCAVSYSRSEMNIFSYTKSPREDTLPSYVLYSPQGSKPLAGVHVEGGVARPCYDKSSKSQLLKIMPSTRVLFLRGSPPCTAGGGSNSSTTLAVASQRIIILQLYCEESAHVAFSLKVELTLQDKLGRHRIVFSNSFQKKQRCVQHVKVPIHCISPGVWTNLVFDVPHLHTVFCGDLGGRLSAEELSGSRRLLHVTLSCSTVCCVRRLLGMPQLPPLTDNMMGSAEWPLSLHLPPGVPFHSWVIRTGDEFFLYSPTNGSLTAIPACGNSPSLSEKVGLCRASSPSSSGGGTLLHDACTMKPSSHPQPFHSLPVSQVTDSSQKNESAAGPLYSCGLKWHGVPTDLKPNSKSDGEMFPLKLSTMEASHERQERGISCENGYVPQRVVLMDTVEGVQGTPPYALKRRHVSVQTNNATEVGLHTMLTSSSDLQAPSNVRPMEMGSKEDEKQKKHQGEGNQHPSMKNMNAVGGNEINAAERLSAPPKAPESTSRGHLDLPTNLWEMGDTRRVNAPHVSVPVRGAEAITSRPRMTSLVDYQRTLQLMCERVKCIQALINESDCVAGYCNAKGIDPREVGTNGNSNKNGSGSSSSSSRNGGCDRVEEDRRGGRTRLHPPVERHVLKNNTQTQEQFSVLHKPRSSPRFYSDQLHHVTGGQSNSREGLPSPRGKRGSSDGRVPAASHKDTDSDDEEHFTVKVCMSCDQVPEAVIVPAESTALDMRPPIPPTPQPQGSHLSTHEVNRLCFDLMPSEMSFQESRVHWSFCGPTPRAEEDTTVVSPLLSPPPPAAGRSLARAEVRSRRLGEQAAVMKAPSHESPLKLTHEVGTTAVLDLRSSKLPNFQCEATEPSSVTSFQSLHLGRSAEEVESSLGTLNYRRSSVAGRAATTTTTSPRRAHFMRLGSARVDGNNEDILSLASQNAFFPPQTLLPHADASRVSSEVSLPRGTNTHAVTRNGDTSDQMGDTRAVHTKTPTLTITRGDVGRAEEQQIRENMSDSLLFDPLLQCCLDLRSNTYVMATRYPQKGAV